MTDKTEIDNGLRLALAAAGGVHKLARLIGVSPQAVAKWRHVPIGRIGAVERATGVPHTLLNPVLGLFKSVTFTGGRR